MKPWSDRRQPTKSRNWHAIECKPRESKSCGKTPSWGSRFVFSLPPDSGIADRQFFTDCAAWAELKFGGATNILSVDIHRDEATPHCHVLLLPLVEGKMVGSEMVGDRRKLLDLQQDFHRSVAARYGLRKAAARLSGSAKTATVASVLSRLNSGSDPALRSKAWPAIRDALDRDPAPFALTLGIAPVVPTKKLRTMTQIFTSQGKGGSVEKPIGFDPAPAKRNLCSVGFAAPAPTSGPPATAPAAIPAPAIATATTPRAAHGLQSETTRERECDQDPAMYDADIGEFRQVAELPAQVRAGLVAWAELSVAKMDTTSAGTDDGPLDWKHQA